MVHNFATSAPVWAGADAPESQGNDRFGGNACASVWQGCNKRTVKRYHLIDKLSLQGSGRERAVNRARGGLSLPMQSIEN